MRLVTLLGTGGTGKTRLAIQLALNVQDEFDDGIFFVDLSPIDDPELVASSIAAVVGVRESASRSLAETLKVYFGDREALLIIDNFEHVLDGVELVAHLLASTPKVRYLITSREALNLQEEWLYPLNGLHVPENADVAGIEEYGAVSLFVQSARRVRPDYSLADEAQNVVRICQLAGGLPLAIELAASWTKTLDTGAIAEEIERGIDFLATRMRNIPERHRSMRATFEYSWRQLGGQQRAIFQQLSVFRGGFRRQAAKEVAGATVLDLSDLVEKSLLRWQPGDSGAPSSGRYQVHKLLRQYAWEKLEESQNHDHIRQRHSTYFSDFLFDRQQDLNGGRQREATVEIAAELENIRAAWHAALEYRVLDNIQKAGLALQAYYQFQSLYLEGADEFEKAVRTLEEEEKDRRIKITLSELLVGLGWLQIRLGRFVKAEESFNKSLKLWEDEKMERRVGTFNNPGMGLGVLANIRGDYAQAEKIAHEALEQGTTKVSRSIAIDSFYVLTNATYAQGRYEEARGHGQEAYALADEIGDLWMISYILNDLGDIERVLFDFDQARWNYQRSYEIRQAFDDSEGMAVALNGLGNVALSEQRYGEAEDMYGRSRVIYQEIGDRGGLARALDGLGNVAACKGDHPSAQAYYSEALSVSEEIHFDSLTLTILIDVASWLATVDRAENGTELSALVLNHPAASHETRARAERSMAAAARQLPLELFASAQERGRAMDLEEAVSTLLKTIERPHSWPGTQGALATAESPKTDQPLIEPLTARELEVLQLMAGGLTNPQIAEELVIAVGTVKSYTGQIYGKLGVNNRVKAVNRAREIGLI